MYSYICGINCIITTCRQQLYLTSDQCPRPGDLCGLGHISENSRLKDHVLLLQRIASDQKYSAVSQQTSSLVAGYVTCPDMPGLWKHQTRWHIWSTSWSTTVSTQRSCATGCDGRKCDHISPLLRDLHWLRLPQRIAFRLAILVYHCRNNTAPEYLSRDLQWAADSDSRRRLRSSSTHKLMVPRTRLKMVGDRAFGATAARDLVTDRHFRHWRMKKLNGETFWRPFRHRWRKMTVC